LSAADKDRLDRTLIVFVARKPEGGQFIVGWYEDAVLFRKVVQRSPGKPSGWGYFCSAKTKICVLLPLQNRTHEIPAGKGGMGQANLCYPLDGDGSPKSAQWIEDALNFVSDYQAANILLAPEIAAEDDAAAAVEEALAQAKGQGFPRTPEERHAIEDHAMQVAKAYYRNRRFVVEDVSKRRSYDLLCKRGKKEFHVEVKGTTTDGCTIVLTRNEVRHACDADNACVLFILHSISLKGSKASGGKRVSFEPWHLLQNRLTPMSYTYRVP
jgi:hypothetical protein